MLQATYPAGDRTVFKQAGILGPPNQKKTELFFAKNYIYTERKFKAKR